MPSFPDMPMYFLRSSDLGCAPAISCLKCCLHPNSFDRLRAERSTVVLLKYNASKTSMMHFCECYYLRLNYLLYLSCLSVPLIRADGFRPSAERAPHTKICVSSQTNTLELNCITDTSYMADAKLLSSTL